jgi:hypothetical protein
MGVKVLRLTLGDTPQLTTIDEYSEATSFWYDSDDKVMYVQVDNRYIDGEWQPEINLAAYPKGMYVRVWLDPLPSIQTAEEYNAESDDVEGAGTIGDGNEAIPLSEFLQKGNKQ